MEFYPRWVYKYDERIRSRFVDHAYNNRRRFSFRTLDINSLDI